MDVENKKLGSKGYLSFIVVGISLLIGGAIFYFLDVLPNLKPSEAVREQKDQLREQGLVEERIELVGFDGSVRSYRVSSSYTIENKEEQWQRQVDKTGEAKVGSGDGTISEGYFEAYLNVEGKEFSREYYWNDEKVYSKEQDWESTERDKNQLTNTFHVGRASYYGSNAAKATRFITNPDIEVDVKEQTYTYEHSGPLEDTEGLHLSVSSLLWGYENIDGFDVAEYPELNLLADDFSICIEASFDKRLNRMIDFSYSVSQGEWEFEAEVSYSDWNRVRHVRMPTTIESMLN